MFTPKSFCKFVTLSIALLFSLSFTAVGQEKSQKKEKVTPQGTPVFWQDPGDVAARDLFLGPGGEEMKPDLSSVTFIKDERGGHSTKYRVRDGAGRVWVAKLGDEAQPETAAVRLVWAVGYETEINYLYPCVHIKDTPPLRKKFDRCEGDGFINVRFEARPKGIKRLENWSWKNNPFVGKNEFKGFIVLMGLLNNWDLKDTNNKILFVPGENGENELRYIVSDLGATFGKTGSFISHTRNEPEQYAKTKFITGIKGGRVQFDYHGKNSGLFDDITVEQAKWMGDLLSRLTDQQLTDAFRAANFSQEDIQTLAGAVRARINMLVNLSSPQNALSGK
ncbi:MAG TPA: hypothetical protein VF779_17240 [Pyrinomonadaceae bacterium]